MTVKYLREFQQQNDVYVKEVLEWFQTLSIPTRTPKNVNPVDHKILREIEKLILRLPQAGNEDKELIKFSIAGKMQYLRTTQKEISAMYPKSGYEKTLQGKSATYVKMDSNSYSLFLKNVDSLEYFLNRLTKMYRMAAQGVTIRFVDMSDQRSIAKFVVSDDSVQINAKKVGKTTEEYGSLRYVLLHELAHRYLRIRPQRWNYNSPEWETTKYSTIDSLTGEEKFAELFALSFWKDKYPQYRDVINDFLKKVI